MGYTTDFEGFFRLDRELSPEHAHYLAALNQTRRITRDESSAAEREDVIREAVGLPVGTDGEYFVGETGFRGQDSGSDVINHNAAPASQPGLWLQWTPVQSSSPYSGCPDMKDENADWTGFDAIGWDMGEKFYNYEEWIAYIIEHFIERWGYTLNGEVTWYGEERDDRGVIHVDNNVVHVYYDVLSVGELRNLEKTRESEKESKNCLSSLVKYLEDGEEGNEFHENIMDQKWKSGDKHIIN